MIYRRDEMREMIERREGREDIEGTYERQHGRDGREARGCRRDMSYLRERTEMRDGI